VPFDYDAERKIFEKTFAILARTLGEYSFGWLSKSGEPVARFSAYHFEAFTLGLQPVVDRLSLDDSDKLAELREVLLAIKKDQAFIDVTTGGGKNSRLPWERRVAAVRDRLVVLA
jgi:hypothetical protein